MDEATLIDKLLKIEALFAGATTAGEKVSADMARERILRRLQESLPKNPPIEYKFTFQDMWSKKVFNALLRRYNLKPYRYHGQRYTTVMVDVPKLFVDETLWPEFQKINKELSTYLDEVTHRVVKQVLHEDDSDAEVVEEPLQIGMKNSQTTNSEERANSENEKTDADSNTQKKKKTKLSKKKKKKRKR